jgi:hypothetical protein
VAGAHAPAIGAPMPALKALCVDLDRKGATPRQPRAYAEERAQKLRSASYVIVRASTGGVVRP